MKTFKEFLSESVNPRDPENIQRAIEAALRTTNSASDSFAEQFESLLTSEHKEIIKKLTQADAIYTPGTRNNKIHDLVVDILDNNNINSDRKLINTLIEYIESKIL